VAKAVRLLLREPARAPQPDRVASGPASTSLGSIGAPREDADLLDQAVAHAMKVREERPWRLGSVE